MAKGDYVLALLPLSVVLIAALSTIPSHHELWFPCGILLLVSVAAFFITERLIEQVKEMTLKAHLYGLDINKKGTPEGDKKM